MSDEQFHRMWSAGHEQFSADVDKGTAKLRRIIDAAYGEPSPSAETGAKHLGEAMLAGLAASVVTLVVFASTIFVTTAGVVLA